MNLQMRWVGQQDYDTLAQARLRCYGGVSGDLPRFAEGVRDDRRAVEGDYLLAERDGQAVGTATSMSLAMWVRGGRVSCQGVGWVGTIKTHRRGSGEGPGIASQVMWEALCMARQRGQVVSALMPFRGSFYEHFGYGIVERRCAWTVPPALMPHGAFDGVGFLEPADRSALAACRQRVVERGQCDIERSPAGWDVYLGEWEEAMAAVDRGADGSIRGYLAFQHAQKNEKDVVNVTEIGYDDIDGLRRLLHFLASLRDQYSVVTLTLPTDLPLNWMLREAQLPHRLVNHPHAQARPYTRMQVRVLDHKRLIEAMRLPAAREGKVVVAVKESEGNESRFALDYSAGRASAAATESPAQFHCPDRIWAPIVCGDLKATTAVRIGLATESRSGAAEALDVFCEGPVPFCQEYF